MSDHDFHEASVQKSPPRHLWLSLGLALLTACASTPLVTPTASPATATANPLPASPTPTSTFAFKTVDFAEAESMAVVSDGVGVLYVVFGQGQGLFVTRSTDGGQTFSAAVAANGDIPAHVLGIERPAIAVSQEGQLGVAWLEMPPDYEGGKVWYAHSADGGQTFTPGQGVATDISGETTMVEVALDAAGNPLLAWLNGRHLRFARSVDHGQTFTNVQNVGTGACECCQPDLAVFEDQVYLAHRSLEPGNTQGDIRDLVVHHSRDGGQTFGPVARASDAHWYLSACPIAGPALSVDADNVYVAWMDGRSAPPGTFDRGEVWLARSVDGGQHFAPNVRLNPDATLHQTKPTIALGPGGRLHVAWEAQGTAAVLYYTFSDDRGQTFAPPQIIASNADPARGRPQMPVLTVTPTGQIALAWIDRLGAHLAVWDETP